MDFRRKKNSIFCRRGKRILGKKNKTDFEFRRILFIRIREFLLLFITFSLQILLQIITITFYKVILVS